MSEENDFRISDKQQDILKQFIENVSCWNSQTYEDKYYLRWLRARNFDLSKSEEMLKKHFEWRKKWEVDTILVDYTPAQVLTEYYPFSIIGFGREGHPIGMVVGGFMDMRGLSRSVKRDEIMKYCIYQCERLLKYMEDASVKFNKKIDRYTVINDMENFSLSMLFQPGMDILLDMMAMMEANYPETLEQSIIINTSRVFPIAYNLLKPFMHEETRRRIRVYGKNYTDKLLNVITADQLPKHWGGDMVDENGDPKCPSRVNWGGTVPTSYYLNITDIVDPEKLQVMTISKGRQHEEVLDIARSNQIIRWVFKTEVYDIKFGIHFRETPNHNNSTVLSITKVKSHLVPQDGVHECSKPGQYILVWDNKYSWVHSKKLSFFTEIIKPQETDSIDYEDAISS